MVSPKLMLYSLGFNNERNIICTWRCEPKVMQSITPSHCEVLALYDLSVPRATVPKFWENQSQVSWIATRMGVKRKSGRKDCSFLVLRE